MLLIIPLLLKSVLSVFRYPAFPAELVGPFEVGAIQTRIPGSVACQIHYPTNEGTSKAAFHPYFRTKAVEGLSDYSKVSIPLLEFLSNRNHPCSIGAEPIQDETFPIVMFSHGLGGSMEMYTQLCQQIASKGFWVVALEHEDGSGAFAETDLGERVPYKRPDDSPYSRQKVLNFRRPFLQKRVQETTSALDYILASPPDACDKNDDRMIDPQLQRVLRAADRTKDVSLLGHSFGGASMVMTVREYVSRTHATASSSSSAPTTRIASLNVLDPWAFTLEDNVLQEGVSSIPTLSILSESWLNNRETGELLKSSEKVSSFYMPKSVHVSFSDPVTWLPGMVLRKMYMRGAKEKRYETIQAVARGCAQHMRSALANDETNVLSDPESYSPLEPYPFKEQLPSSEFSTEKERKEEPVDVY